PIWMVMVSPLKSGLCAVAGAGRDNGPRQARRQVRTRGNDIANRAFLGRAFGCVRIDAIGISGPLVGCRSLIDVRPIGVGKDFQGGDRMALIGISRVLAGAALSLAAVLAAYPVRAQTDPAAGYPNKPIRIIVPFAAGGGNDIFARLVGQKFSDLIGQTIVIENRPAAGGRIAAEFVANQPGDGYTLFVGASGVMS